jgi:type II secretory pathway component GspD/PulD (secretin)
LELDPLNAEAKVLAEELDRSGKPTQPKGNFAKTAPAASPQGGDIVLAALDEQKPARGGAAPEPAAGAGTAKPSAEQKVDAVPISPPAPARRATRRTAGKADSAGEAEAAFQKGLVAYESGRLDVAVQWWNYALTLQPGHQRAIDYLTMTRADYDAWVQQHQYNAIELQKEADSSGKLATPITYDTAGQKSIVEFLSAVSLITDVSFYVTDGVDPEIRVTAKFDQTPLADALDIVLLPIGLKWMRSGDVVTVTPDLRTKFFNLSPDQVSRLKTVLESKTLQRLLYGPEGVPPMRNTELLLDDRQNVLIVTDSQENINKVEAFLKDMQIAGPPALVYRSWKIKPEEGNKIKALVEAVIRVQSDAPYDLERKVVVDGEDLIVKDTADNIARIEELLLDKNFIKKLETQTLKVATFNLTPRAPLSENLEQTRDLAQNIVTVVKTILYSQSTESAAAAEGRRYWYDPNTLQLTITDYPSNLQVVSDYIRSLPIFEQKLKSEIIFLKHQTAEDLANLLNQVLGLGETDRGGTQTGNAVTKTLRVEGELTFRDLRIRVTRINENDAADKNDDSVDLVIRTPTTSEDRTIEEFRSEFIDDYEVNVIEVRPSGTPGEGSARIEVRFNPAATGVTAGGFNQGFAGPAGGGAGAAGVAAIDPNTGLPIAAPTQKTADVGLSIDTISNMNALLIRYEDPGELAQVKSWIEQLDIPVLQVSIETKLVEVNERRAKEFLPEFSIANLGQGISLADNVLNSRFAQYADEFRDPFDPFPEDPFSGGLLKGTTVLDFTSIGESPVNFTLRMLEMEGVLNVVNGPHVTVENGENASFQIEKFFGALPQLQVGGTGTTGQGFVQSLQQVDFEVTPQITQLGEIRLEIQNLVLQDFGNEGGVESVIDIDGSGSGDPFEPTAIARSLTYDRRRRSLETVARVRDGGTIVLGGWTGERTTQNDSGVPILRQIPYIGKLFFNRTADRVDKTTLLIFLTCHIVKP